MHTFAKWLTPLFTLGVAIFIIWLLVDINQGNPKIDMQTKKESSSAQNQTLVTEKRWIDTLAASERQGYFYPVNEIFIDLDLNQRLINEKIYRLSALLHDPYQLFCLKQELSQHQLRYTLKSDNDQVQFIVYTKQKDRIDALVKRLKNYNITANYLPEQEDHQWKNIK